MILQCIAHNPLLTHNYTNEYEKAKDSTLKYEDTDKRFTKERIEKLPIISEEDDEWHKQHKAIAIHGYWYDVTNFIEFHPGGDVILKFLRCDATTSFYGNHPFPEEIIKKRWPIARHKTDKDYLVKNKKLNDLYWRLHHAYTELGLMEPSLKWLIKVHCVNAIMAAVSVYICNYYPNNGFFNGIVTGNFLLGCAFMTHDSCHNIVHRSKAVTNVIRWINADVIFGVSSRWWKFEHNEHHALTNAFDAEKKVVCDLQACEDFWCQSEKTVAFFRAFYHPVVIRFQHYLTLPLCLFVGRIGIMVDCWIASELLNWHWKNLIGIVLHWTWVIYLCRLQNQPWLFYFVFSCYQGTLALQLVSNHIMTPFEDIKEIKYMNFGKRMTEVTVNLKTSRWFDWFFGGLHFHIEHHVFAKMPRNTLRLVNFDIKKMMKDNGVEYRYEYIWNVFISVNQHLKKISKVWLEDYRAYKKEIQ